MGLLSYCDLVKGFVLSLIRFCGFAVISLDAIFSGPSWEGHKVSMVTPPLQLSSQQWLGPHMCVPVLELPNKQCPFRCCPNRLEACSCQHSGGCVLPTSLPPWPMQTFSMAGVHGGLPGPMGCPALCTHSSRLQEWKPNTWYGMTTWQWGVGQLVSTNLGPKLGNSLWLYLHALEISCGLEPPYTQRQAPPLTEPVTIR